MVAQARMLPEAAERLSPAWQVVMAYSEVLQNWVQERSGRCLSGVGEKPALLERFDCRCLSHQFEVDRATGRATCLQGLCFLSHLKGLMHKSDSSGGY